MTDFHVGQRVALIRTHDLDNPPRVGRQGTVLAHEPAAQTVTWLSLPTSIAHRS